MKDVADVLSDYLADDDLRALLDALDQTPTAQRNSYFRETLRRIRKAAGFPDPRDLTDGHMELLELMAPEKPED